MGKYDNLLPIDESRAREHAPAERRHRSLGKAKDPAYRQISVYIKQAVHDEAKRKLIGHKDDFSDVVNQLVEAWVAGRFAP